MRMISAFDGPPSGAPPMGAVGSLWNHDLSTRLRSIAERVARQAVPGEAPTRRSPPQFQRRRAGLTREAIAAVLGEHKDGLQFRNIAAAVATQLGEQVPHSSIKSCLWREARSPLGHPSGSGEAGIACDSP